MKGCLNYSDSPRFPEGLEIYVCSLCRRRSGIEFADRKDGQSPTCLEWQRTSHACMPVLRNQCPRVFHPPFVRTQLDHTPKHANTETFPWKFSPSMFPLTATPHSPCPILRAKVRNYAKCAESPSFNPSCSTRKLEAPRLLVFSSIQSLSTSCPHARHSSCKSCPSPTSRHPARRSQWHHRHLRYLPVAQSIGWRWGSLEPCASTNWWVHANWHCHMAALEARQNWL